MIRFHLLEMNGTGIGGLTNLPEASIEAVLTSFSEMADEENDKDNKTNTCVGCHTTLIGRERPPCSHFLILGRPCQQ